MSKQELAEFTIGMNDTIRHRGPDAGGVYVEDQARFSLGHRRLAVMDLSDAGSQPMASRCGRYVIAFNGEIYNFKDLARRYQLGEISSDTRVLVELIAKLGLDKALPLINGMFAFAVYDKSVDICYLARDRVGKKPLYYGKVSRDILFSSELKAFRLHESFTGELSVAAVNKYFQYKYIPSPLSIYDGVFKVHPGTYVKIENGDLSEKVYWSLQSKAKEGLASNINEYEDQLRETLVSSVRDRMESDVPLGAFLSGGIDSSLIVSVMQSISDHPIKTFSIGKYDSDDEAQLAKNIASYLGTEHHELYVDDLDAMKLVEDIPKVWDEPFSDSSQLPMLIVSKMARQNVTVALSGDGGDELFGGYVRYQEFLNSWKRGQRLSLYSLGINVLGSQVVRPAVDLFDRFSQSELLLRTRLNWRQSLREAKDFESYYDLCLSDFGDNNEIIKGDVLLARNPFRAENSLSEVDYMMLCDQLNYLPNDNLVKVDRGSMAHSLEVRSPLLDYRLIELSWKISAEAKIQDGIGKAPLRNLLSEYLPTPLFDNPKRGFSVPVNNWLLGKLRPWVDSVVYSPIANNQDYINIGFVRNYWERVKKRRTLESKRLWSIVMFLHWLEYNS